MKKTAVWMVALLLNFMAGSKVMAQEMADTMRSNGKIYVVVAVVLIVVAGLLLYLALTDRKITALEKKINNREK